MRRRREQDDPPRNPRNPLAETRLIYEASRLSVVLDRWAAALERRREQKGDTGATEHT